MKKIFLFLILGMVLLFGSLEFMSAYNSSIGLVHNFTMDSSTYPFINSSSSSAWGNATSNFIKFGEDGISGNAIYWNTSGAYSTSKYVQLSFPLSTLESNDYSVTFWIKPDEYAEAGTSLFSAFGGASLSRRITVESNDSIKNVVNYDGDKIIYSNATITNNEWNYLVFIFSAGTRKIYLNGILVAYDGNSYVPSVSPTGLTYLGGDLQGGNTPKGYMDELRFYNRTLNQSEITQYYQELIPSSILVNLTTPLNNSVFSSSSLNLSVNLSMSGTDYDYEWKNATFNIWYSNGTLKNKTIVTGLSTNSTSTSKLFTLGFGKYFWNAYACYNNATFGNCSWATNGNYSFSINSTINSETHNNLTYETITNENYTLNLTSPTIPTNAYLVYNGTSYSATVTNTAGNYYTISRSLPINTINIGLNTFYYKWNLSSTYSENTTTYSQTVSPIQFGLCNGTLTVPFLNFTFKDEATDDFITASIPSSTFVYYLGDGSITKNLTFINNSVNQFYAFCALPSNQTYHIDTYLQYKNGTDYPQRIYDPDVISYTNTTTNTTLYLLSSTDGIYVTFQIVNTADQVISGVEVSATRTIDSTEVEVASGTTGADGTVTFWLNPDFSHDFVFSKSGYTTYETSLIPTQSSYTITLSSSASTVSDDYTKGMKLYIYPKSRELLNDTSYNFIFNLTSRSWELDSFGFSLRLANGTIVGTDSSTTEGSGASITYNTNNQTIIYIDYYWIVEGNYTNGTSYWIVTNSLNTGWSIKTFFTDLSLVLDSGLFGLDDFGRYLLSFLVLFMVVGVMGYKFGTTSPLFISITIFAVVFFLDVVTGLIPAIRGIDNVLTYLAGVILFVTIIAEVAR